MDRNNQPYLLYEYRGESLSARRAWIEIAKKSDGLNVSLVALRKESVDRNKDVGHHCIDAERRSPQGERG